MQSMIARRPSEEDADTKPVAQSAPQSAQTQQQEAAYVPEVPPYVDPAEPILRKHGIDESVAHDLWQQYHDAPDSKALMHALIGVNVPNELKSELYAAKRKHDAAPTWLDRLDKTVEAIKRVAKLHSIPARDGKSVLKLGESHPNVMRVLVDAELKSHDPKEE
jgi:hypothetical protein